jgi:mRNA interferase MazF
MKEGNVALAPIPQADGNIKTRPIILLRSMPPYQDWLVCGVSTQLHQLVPEFDELINTEDIDFASSGLKATSLIRLGFLSLLPRRSIIGSIGSISPDRYQRLLQNLCNHLLDNSV